MILLGAEATVLTNITLILISTGFLILLYGVIFAKKQQFGKHIKMANSAVLFGSAAVLWMFYSLINTYLPLITTSYAGLIIIFHALIGACALFLGILFSLNEIPKTRTTMRAVFLFWIAAMFGGIFIYFNLYIF